MADDISGRPHRPRKRFGQHFLADRGALGRIADALHASPGETVVEIGPGRGALTDELVARQLKVLAIEIDRDLVALLQRRYQGTPNVRVIAGDVLDIELAGVAPPPFRLVGNVPYNITTPIIFHAFRAPRPVVAVFLVQKEVAERLAAAPGSRTYGALSVNVQSVMHVELLGRVKAGAFHPPPKVDSAIVRFTPRDDPIVDADDEPRFRDFVVAVFGQRRKQMVRALRQVAATSPAEAEDVLRLAGVEQSRRPETLTPQEFAALWRILRDRFPGPATER